MLMRLIVIIYDGYIAEGHVVLSTWSSVIDVRCTDAETIYLRNIHIHHRQHHRLTPLSPWECQVILAVHSASASDGPGQLIQLNAALQQ